MRLASIGVELTAAVVGLGLAGYWLGGHFGNAKLGLLIGATLGVIGGMYNVVRVAWKLSKEGEPSDRSSESQSE